MVALILCPTCCGSRNQATLLVPFQRQQSQGELTIGTSLPASSTTRTLPSKMMRSNSSLVRLAAVLKSKDCVEGSPSNRDHPHSIPAKRFQLHQGTEERRHQRTTKWQTYLSLGNT
eukprot:4325100-Amphidinium_carterae.1